MLDVLTCIALAFLGVIVVALLVHGFGDDDDDDAQAPVSIEPKPADVALMSETAVYRLIDRARLDSRYASPPDDDP